MYSSGQGGGGFANPRLGSHTFGGPGAFPFTGQQNSDIERGLIREEAPPAQLYDLENDLDETVNVYEQYPDVVAMMQKRLEEIKKGK
jgi:hypothetical protein